MVTKSGLLWQAELLSKLAQTAADPGLAAALVKRAADARAEAETIDGDSDAERDNAK